MKQILIIAVMCIVLFGCAQETPKQIISSFEECVAASNPVTESNPPQCSADGKTFTGPAAAEPTPAEPEKPVVTPTEPEKPAAPDSHNCEAGNSWNTELNACAPPLDEFQLGAAKSALAPISYPVTVISVEDGDCGGCYVVNLRRDDTGQTMKVPIVD
jgi:hypothetical protein